MKRMGRKGVCVWLYGSNLRENKLITIKEKNNHNAEFNSPERRTCWREMFMAVSTEDRDKGLIHARLAFLLFFNNFQQANATDIPGVCWNDSPKKTVYRFLVVSNRELYIWERERVRVQDLKLKFLLLFSKNEKHSEKLYFAFFHQNVI